MVCGNDHIACKAFKLNAARDGAVEPDHSVIGIVCFNDRVTLQGDIGSGAAGHLDGRLSCNSRSRCHRDTVKCKGVGAGSNENGFCGALQYGVIKRKCAACLNPKNLALLRLNG